MNTSQPRAIGETIACCRNRNDTGIETLEIEVLRGDSLLGRMSFYIVGYGQDEEWQAWSHLSDLSCGRACSDELDVLLRKFEPKAILVLEHFERAEGVVLARGELSSIVAGFMSADSLAEHVGKGSLLVTYPFPLDAYDEMAALRIAKTYKVAWGLQQHSPDSQLLFKEL